MSFGRQICSSISSSGLLLCACYPWTSSPWSTGYFGPSPNASWPLRWFAVSWPKTVLKPARIFSWQTCRCTVWPGLRPRCAGWRCILAFLWCCLLVCVWWRSTTTWVLGVSVHLQASSPSTNWVGVIVSSIPCHFCPTSSSTRLCKSQKCLFSELALSFCAP